MKKYALLAGSNFVGTQNELNGCLNDLDNMRSLLEAYDVEIVADLRGSDMTTSNWKNAMMDIAKKAESGDTIFHSHSHHGAKTRSLDGMGFDEIWCPDDFDWKDAHMIRDDWMAALMDMLKPGVKWIDFCDCCHAGGSLRDLWYQNERPRYIENPELTNKLFGFNSKPTVTPLVVSGENYKGILLAACRSNQTSADAFIDGQYCGAFTYHFLKALRENMEGNYEELMIRTTDLLGLGGYDQKPELDCKTGDEHNKFKTDVLDTL